MTVWRLEGALFCALLCMIIVHSDAYTCEQFLNLLVGLGLDFVFVCLSKFTI